MGTNPPDQDPRADTAGDMLEELETLSSRVEHLDDNLYIIRNGQIYLEREIELIRNATNELKDMRSELASLRTAIEVLRLSMNEEGSARRQG